MIEICLLKVLVLSYYPMFNYSIPKVDQLTVVVINSVCSLQRSVSANIYINVQNLLEIILI